MQETVTTYELLKKVMKLPNLKIIQSIRSGKKRWSDFERLMNKSQVSSSLNELIELGIIKNIERKKGLKKYNEYELTELGEFVVRQLELAEHSLRRRVIVSK